MFTFNNCTVTVNVGKRIAELLAKLDIDLYTDKGVMMTKILVSPKDLSQFAELIVKECVDDGFDRYCFDADGYDRDGYNADGFDADGFDAAGYDADGYDRQGYDTDDLDRDGYDPLGFDRDGVNRHGISH